MNALVKLCDDKMIEPLWEQFQQIDIDETGQININELETALAQCEMQMPASKIREIIQNLQLEKDEGEFPKINYSEFLAATISIKNVLNEDLLWALFKHFDTDNSNYITWENIIEALAKCGREVTVKEMDEIIKRHDLTHDG